MKMVALTTFSNIENIDITLVRFLNTAVTRAVLSMVENLRK